MDSIIFLTYTKLTIVFVCSIVFTITLIKGGRVIKHENAHPSKQEIVKKHEKTLNFIAKGVMIILIASSIWGIIPGVRDIPNIVNQNYNITHCTVLTQSVSGDGEKLRGFYAIDLETNEKMYLKVWSQKIYKDDVFTIQYLPHLKVGAIIK